MFPRPIAEPKQQRMYCELLAKVDLRSFGIEEDAAAEEVVGMTPSLDAAAEPVPRIHHFGMLARPYVLVRVLARAPVGRE